LCFVLFKSFFDANTAREFLQNSSNFKESEKNNFTAKWFKNEDEKDFSDSFKSKIQLIVQKYNENNLKQMQQSMNNNNNMLNAQQPNKYSFYPQNWQQNQMNMMNQQSNMLTNDQNMGYGGNHNMNMNNNNNSNKSKNSNMQQYNGIYGNMMGSGNLGGNNQNFNVSLANGRKNSSNSTADEDRKNQQQQNGKFTCRFEMQIENDKEFQVARRLIGAKVNFFLFFSNFFSEIFRSVKNRILNFLYFYFNCN
jgi:hypothetical protein